MTIRILACWVAMSLSSLALADTVTHYRAELRSDGVIRSGVVGTPSAAMGEATFTLTRPDSGPTSLQYQIQLTGVDLDGAQTADPLDNATAGHIHDINVCVAPGCLPGDTAGTVHVLNFFGFPRLDDDDLVVDAAASTISGIWDDGDENLTAPPTVAISNASVLHLLEAGELYLMIHTAQVPTGAIGGRIVRVPEPGSIGALLLSGIALAMSRRTKPAGRFVKTVG